MLFIRRLENYLFSRFDRRLRDIERRQLSTIILQSLSIAQTNRQKNQIQSLAEVEFCGFSQWGEDGIIDWLIEKLPGIPTTFIEFGVQDYRESNTRLLLQLRNWRGFVMDGSFDFISDIKRQSISWRYHLDASCAFIDCENINQLLLSSGINGSIGLLSIDIDGNDYWVWQKIDVVNPAIVVCEYNAVFGDLHQISVPYRADFQRTKAHYSNLFFGASLPAMVKLAKQKGYVFVGTNSNGCNAFFVRKDLASNVLNSLREIKSFPSLFREARDENGKLSYSQGGDRVTTIRHLPVVDIETKATCSLGDLGELYSQEWLQSTPTHFFAPENGHQ